MEDIEPSVSDKAINTRVSQACQRCRSLKTRCLPSERSGTCKRCFISKRDCIWADTPRKPRQIRGPSRIQQVEQKIDGLVASIVSGGATCRSSTPIEGLPANDSISYLAPMRSDGRGRIKPISPGSWIPFDQSFEQRTDQTNEDAELVQGDAESTQQFVAKLREIHSFGEENDLVPPPNGVFTGSQRSEPGIENETVKSMLANGEADEMLQEYRSMSSSFPFVPLLTNISASELHTTRPMLFLAIITVASWKNRLRQKKLDRIYRTYLADRTIVTPRRTLSLLQSILVYLSRYHFLFSHKTQQIYSLQQVAVGLALDMGLHQRNKRSFMDIPGRPPAARSSPAEQFERQRTFLGCYYMSSMIAGGLQKPNLLKYTEYMAECCRSLEQGREYPSDLILGRLVGLRRLDDQILESFYSEDTFELHLTDPRILMNFRFMENQLHEVRDDDCSQELQRVIDLSSSFTNIQLHAIALRSPTIPNQPTPQDPIQLNCLLVTLEACKRHLDLLLDIQASDYHLISFSEWMRLPYVLITHARLCIPSDALTAAQWDVKSAHERARLDLYLDSLCYRMQGISTSPFDFWFIMKMILELMRDWFIRKIHPKSTTSTQPNLGGIPTPNTAYYSNPDVTAYATSRTHVPNGGTDDGQCPMGNTDAIINGPHGNNDPFAFMRGAEFDMDSFFELGLWSDETYTTMGFGGGMRF